MPAPGRERDDEPLSELSRDFTDDDVGGFGRAKNRSTDNVRRGGRSAGEATEQFLRGLLARNATLVLGTICGWEALSFSSAFFILYDRG